MKVVNTINFCSSKINTIYFNDLHGSTKNLSSFTQVHDEFLDKNKDTPTLTLCGGDMFLERNTPNEKVAEKLAPRVDAVCAGNHDLEGGNYLYSLIKNFNMSNKWLSCNILFTKASPLQKTLLKSTIIKKNNERIGIIGVSPLELNKISFIRKEFDFIKVKPLDKTIEAIDKEVKILENKGINKIFLLAHTGEYGKNGEKYYKEFAKIGGIDVIVGGHDHIETDKWAVSSRKEPVKIVSTGKSPEHCFKGNLDIIGILNLEFDDNGVLIKENCSNCFEQINRLCDNTEVCEKEVIYHLTKPMKQGDQLYGYSEAANIVTDSNLWYVNKHTKGLTADFALVNTGTIRSNFDNEEISLEDIKNVVPFTTSTLIKTTLTKKQIIDTLNWCALSTTFRKVSPGLMQVSGMEYDVDKDLNVCNVHILNDDGSIKYNLDDFPNDKEFTAVYDIFLATGVAGLKDLKKDLENDQNIEFFDAARQDALYEYLSECTEIKDYSRVRINRCE